MWYKKQTVYTKRERNSKLEFEFDTKSKTMNATSNKKRAPRRKRAVRAPTIAHSKKSNDNKMMMDKIPKKYARSSPSIHLLCGERDRGMAMAMRSGVDNERDIVTERGINEESIRRYKPKKGINLILRNIENVKK